MFKLTVFQVMALNTLIIPALVAIITKKAASGPVKQVALIVLSAIGGFVAVMVADVNYEWQATATLIVSQIVTASAAYFGLDQVVYLPLARKTADFGIGKAA